MLEFARQKAQKNQGGVVLMSGDKKPPGIFYYKMGFRFLEEDLNKILEKCIKSKDKAKIPNYRMMYLKNPKESITEHYWENKLKELERK